MKKIIITLQRSELNYLIKYDTQKVSSDRIINFSYSDFQYLSEEQKVSLLEQSMPIYEQEHEVLLIEYNPKLVSYHNGISLEFAGISSIIPLTEIASQLLSTKLNPDFKITDPLDKKLYTLFFNNRNNNLRFGAGEKICSFYEVPLPNEKFIENFRKATLFQLNDTSPQPSDSTLAHLIDFNTTPSFIPEGNVEALIKSACVGMKKLGKEVEQITRSKFYGFVLEHKDSINRKSLFQGIKYVEDEIRLSEGDQEGLDKLKATLNEKRKLENAFLYFSYFYYLKKEIEKNEYDISTVRNDILELKYHDADAASKVLFMLGYTFSIQTISKSLQSFSNSQLLKTKKVLDLKWAPPVTEDTPTLTKANDDVEMDTFNSEKIHEEKIYEVEDEKPHVVELSLNNKSEEADSSYEQSISKEDPPFNNGIDLFSGQKESSNDKDKAEFPQAKFNFKEFKRNIGGGGFSRKILSALQERGLSDPQITEQTIISCLEEIEHYRTKKGEISSNAKKALKIFE